jgi:hypothetical protein
MGPPISVQGLRDEGLMFLFSGSDHLAGERIFIMAA